MSERYPGGFITKNAPQPTGGESGVADGIWTLEQALEYKQAGTWPIPVQPVYVEDVFSTYLYTGNGSTQTITNGIDLSGKGGLLWIKERANVSNHLLFDSQRTLSTRLASNLTNAELAVTNGITSFNNNGFSVGASGATNAIDRYVSWTFRKQPKFFDIVTYTGNGSNRTISHNLGSTPGCIIVKSTSNSEWWAVYHRSLGATKTLYLNSNNAQETNATNWNNTEPTSAVFTVGTNTPTNANGQTYVAYLFAHDAGGFGPLGTDNVISCGSFTTNASGGVAEQTLGYEPQFAIFKQTTSTGDRWRLVDNMRGMFVGTPYTGSPALYPNLTDAESPSEYFNVSATGFSMPDGTLSGSQTYIYIAIRRGPMKTPTSGTSVFDPIAYSGTSTNNRIITSSVTPDLVVWANRSSTGDRYEYDRLRGSGTWLKPNTTQGEGADGTTYGAQFDKVQTGYQQGTADGGFLNSSSNYVNWLFRRAPGFFDVVCYTGTSSARTVNHNLGVVPELMIVKTRTESGRGWAVYAAPLGATKWLRLELTNPEATVSTVWNNTTPTSSVFTVGISAWTNNNTQSFVNYLFASCPGVSKIGSYIGNGSTQNINCDFVGSARFILIKKSEGGGGNWLVFDSARGITAGNDPVLTLNTTDAETNTTDLVNANTGGFQVVSPGGGLNDPNENNCTYIFLAIA